MGSWSVGNIGFACEESIRRKVKELLECCGVNFEDKYSSEDEDMGFIPEADDFGYDCGDLDTDTIYTIVNTVFDNVKIFYVYDDGNEINDSYYGCEKTYDPKKNKVQIYEDDYSYDGDLVFGESVFMVIKDECEKVAKEKGIPIVWNREYPNGQGFIELCEKILEERGGIEELGSRTEIIDIPKVRIYKEDIIKIIECAKEKGYLQLIDMVTNSFDIEGLN